MANIEQLWRDYLEFEKNINPIIAEKMNIERGRDYMNARRVGKELEAETRGLNRHLPSVPPSGQPEEIKQVIISKLGPSVPGTFCQLNKTDCALS